MTTGAERQLQTVQSRAEADTEAAGAGLAGRLGPGAVVLLTGDLGAGKTAFVRGLARGLGIDPLEVSSPTFALVHEYRGGRLPLFHVDLYRLTATAASDLGLDELAAGPGVLAVEWPDRLDRVFPRAFDVRLQAHAGEDQDARRTIWIRSPA